MSPVTAHTHKKLNICYLSYASTLDFVTKTHSFRDKMLQIFNYKLPQVFLFKYLWQIITLGGNICKNT